MSTKKRANELRPEYDLTTLPRPVRGKYFKRATAGTNLVLIEPDVASVFPNGEAINDALRGLIRTEESRLEKGRGKRHQRLPRRSKNIQTHLAGKS